jgi:hypothetical protein
LKDFEIRPGDRLFCLGFPLGAEANEAGFPILRSGNIASFPLLPTSKTKTFLFDFAVFGGNSGGPVYFEDTNRIYRGTTNLGESIHFIIGLVSEQHVVTQMVETINEKRLITTPLSVAVVVHASLIREAVEMLPEKP